MDIREICNESIAVYSHDNVERPRAGRLTIYGLGEHAGQVQRLGLTV